MSAVPVPADATDGGPHSESPAARFIEAYADVFTLVGSICREAGAGEGDPFGLRVAPGIVREFDPEFLPMLQFFRTARTKQQAIDWLAWAGAPQGALQDLVKSRLLVRVNTTNPLTAAASLKGVRIVPRSIPGEPAIDQPTLISVRRGTSSPEEAFVSVELGHVLWGMGLRADLSSAIKGMARESGERRDLVARRVLTNAPALLSLGLAELEWTCPPRALAWR